MSWLPKLLKGKAGISCLSSQEVLAVAALAAGLPQAQRCILLYYEPSAGLPRRSVCVLSLHVASGIPSLAIHAPHSGPRVRLRIVGLHGAQPQLPVIPSDSIEKPVHHSHTHTASGCCHGMALFPAIGDRVEHFHHIQGITCIKICYSN